MSKFINNYIISREEEYDDAIYTANVVRDRLRNVVPVLDRVEKSTPEYSFGYVEDDQGASENGRYRMAADHQGSAKRRAAYYDDMFFNDLTNGTGDCVVDYDGGIIPLFMFNHQNNINRFDYNDMRIRNASARVNTNIRTLTGPMLNNFEEDRKRIVFY